MKKGATTIAFVLAFMMLTSSCTYVLPKRFFETEKKHEVFPEPIGFVNDFDDVFTDAEEKTLNALILRHKKQTTNEIAIITIQSIAHYEDLYKYSLDLANYWGVGQGGKDNGVLIAIYNKNREIRIQNGFGIEERLTDEETQRVLQNDIIPHFKKGKYFEGIKQGLRSIMAEIR